MSAFIWNTEQESRLMKMREDGKTYQDIARTLGISLSAVKHKARRIMQASNLDKYKHTKEKADIFNRTFKASDKKIKILETHCGFGGMTELYSKIGNVTAIDINQDRVNAVSEIENVTAVKADCEKEIYRLVYNKEKFDIVDIDPYGLPSRLFPMAFSLIDDGYLYLTMPMIGVAQVNKITIRHYLELWGINIKDTDTYIEKITERLASHAFFYSRQITVISCDKIDRIFRMAIRVKKASMLDICDLKVQGKNTACKSVNTV